MTFFCRKILEKKNKVFFQNIKKVLVSLNMNLYNVRDNHLSLIPLSFLPSSYHAPLSFPFYLHCMCASISSNLLHPPVQSLLLPGVWVGVVACVWVEVGVGVGVGV